MSKKKSNHLSQREKDLRECQDEVMNKKIACYDAMRTLVSAHRVIGYEAGESLVRTFKIYQLQIEELIRQFIAKYPD